MAEAHGGPIFSKFCEKKWFNVELAGIEAALHDQGLPIGSGIAEAACKTVFTEGFMASGMSWNCESGQHILVLRLAWLSGVWRQTVRSWLNQHSILRNRRIIAWNGSTAPL